MPFANVTISKEQELFRRMQQLGVSESDIDESFVRSSGPGGQNVNKVSTCVVIIHRPTGLSVKCQESRSQGLNRFYARRILLDKIERQQKGFIEEERQRVEKIRRQKRKRSKRAKEKMLEHKHKHSEKKKSRGRVSMARLDSHY
ncbi:MAG: peptide chain release factor-like protein [Candidatus Omnitrophica bacterium]|nr:peptide chain release factor-like protein [Candidatus Omnitrophota bacterium]